MDMNWEWPHHGVYVSSFFRQLITCNSILVLSNYCIWQLAWLVNIKVKAVDVTIILYTTIWTQKTPLYVVRNHLAQRVGFKTRFPCVTFLLVLKLVLYTGWPRIQRSACHPFVVVVVALWFVCTKKVNYNSWFYCGGGVLFSFLKPGLIFLGL